jgi:hypothetical protein
MPQYTPSCDMRNAVTIGDNRELDQSQRLRSHVLEAQWGAASLAWFLVPRLRGVWYHLKRQKDRVEQDFKAGKIDQKEYEIRKDQIGRDLCSAPLKSTQVA